MVSLSDVVIDTVIDNEVTVRGCYQVSAGSKKPLATGVIEFPHPTGPPPAQQAT